MAEAVAIVGLVASIASLVDVSAKVVSRLYEFASKFSDVPKSFRSVWVRLPLMTVTLQQIHAQAEAGHLLDDIMQALKLVVDDTSEQVLAVQTCLSEILPPDSASKVERAVKALKSLAREDKVQQAMEKIDKNIDILVLHQTTQQVDMVDLVLARLTELTKISKSESGSPGKDKVLSLAGADRKSILEDLRPQTQSILSNSNRGLLFRFSQLPVAVQEIFIAQQEKQLYQFVDQEEAKVFELLSVFDTRERLVDLGRYRAKGTCEWILKSRDYLDWVHGKSNRLRILGGAGSGKSVASAFIFEALSLSLGKEDILAVYACSYRDLQPSLATNIFCALARQIAKNSLASMDKLKRFLERHVSDGKLKSDVLDLQDLIVEMSLSVDIHRIFIIIDGLDQGVWEQSDHLMAVVEIPQRARKVKMLITSRRDPLIAEALHAYSILSRDDVILTNEVVAFIDRELKRTELANLPQQDLDEIRRSLLLASNGVFLYATFAISLLLDSYQNPPTSQEAREALLQDLPRRLDKACNQQYFTMQRRWR